MGIRPTKKPYEFLPSLDGERLQDYTSPKSVQQKRRSLPRGANGGYFRRSARTSNGRRSADSC